MSVVRDVHIVIKGQVSDDYRDNKYEVILAKLRVICAEYELDLVENSENYK